MMLERVDIKTSRTETVIQRKRIAGLLSIYWRKGKHRIGDNRTGNPLELREKQLKSKQIVKASQKSCVKEDKALNDK